MHSLASGGRPSEPTGQGERIRSICLIGAGNVATRLAPVLQRHARILQVLAQHEESAARLAAQIGDGCTPIDSPTELRPDADLYLIAAKDDSIASIAASTPDFPGIWAHTSGSVGIDVFSGLKSNFGVLYPLQTFSKDIEVEVAEVPFLVEGNTQHVADALLRLAEGISRKVALVSSEERRKLHVAAVFACNFANLMWLEADELLRDAGLDISYLLPLIQATVDKLRSLPPAEAMTGPARRGDTAVIRSHLDRLQPDKAEIYRLLSENILKRYHNVENTL